MISNHIGKMINNRLKPCGKMDIEKIITAAYIVLLDREPDKTGMEFWLTKFQDGITKDEFLSSLINSAEFNKYQNRWYFDPIKSKPSGIDISYLIERGLKIGNNCTIHYDTILDPSHCDLIEIGNNVTFAPRGHVLAHDGSMKTALGYTKIGKVVIEDNVFVGAGAIILPNVRIGKNSIIGAGSVVTHNVPENSVSAGNPARTICDLDFFLDKHKALANVRKNGELHNGFGYQI